MASLHPGGLIHIPAPGTGTTMAPNPMGGGVLQYQQEIEDTGAMQSKDDDKEKTHRFVREKLWPKLKFIASKNDLEFEGRISKYIMKYLNVQDCNRRSYWNSAKVWVPKKLQQKQSNVTGSIQKAFIGTCFARQVRPGAWNMNSPNMFHLFSIIILGIINNRLGDQLCKDPGRINRRLPLIGYHTGVPEIE